MRDRLRERDLTPGAYADERMSSSSTVIALVGGALLGPHYNSGSRMVAGVRYIAKPTTLEPLFSYRRAT